MQNNFKCSRGHEFHQAVYQISIQEGESVFWYKGSKLKCPVCNEIVTSAINQIGDYTTSTYGKFASAGEDEKKRMLRNRATAHNKRTEEQYRTIDKEFKGTTNTKHY